MGRNDEAWEALFSEHRILERIARDGYFEITAPQIKKYREPRLMTKFDHRVNLPGVFRENNLAILPITRGSYVISSFQAYQELVEPTGEPRRIRLPAHLQSLVPRFLVSEAIALNCANACGILADFLGEDELVSTVSGRMSTGSFDFFIETGVGPRKVSVENAQMEIDAAYEGRTSLTLLEAKRDLSSDFLIRQLYYPFRVWKERVTKRVRPVFLIYSNGVFSLYEYQFENADYYNSLYLTKQKNYRIAAELTTADLATLLKTVPVEHEPAIPFPQANSMARLINLMELLFENAMSKQEITGEYAFDERQTNYYTDAGRYLDLIEKERGSSGEIRFTLTSLGKKLMAMEYRQRQIAIVTQMLKHRVFHEALKASLRCGKVPETAEVVRMMKGAGLYHVQADSTFVRRSSTVTGWLHWIIDLTENAPSGMRTANSGGRQE